MTIVVGFEAMIKRNLLFRIIFYVIVAAVVILQFFPGTWDNLMGYVGAMAL